MCMKIHPEVKRHYDVWHVLSDATFTKVDCSLEPGENSNMCLASTVFSLATANILTVNTIRYNSRVAYNGTASSVTRVGRGASCRPWGSLLPRGHHNPVKPPMVIHKRRYLGPLQHPRLSGSSSLFCQSCLVSQSIVPYSTRLIIIKLYYKHLLSENPLATPQQCCRKFTIKLLANFSNMHNLEKVCFALSLYSGEQQT